jgi:hypothetical protein
VANDRLGRRLGERRVDRVERRRGPVRRCDPEHRVSVGERSIDDRRVTVRSRNHLDALECLRRQARRIADDHADRLVGRERSIEDLMADQAGGGGDDDHGSPNV